ncbi:beta-N-acetylhexosaminidase [Psychrobacillus sp. FJAT-21963]|uniref:beta-N-acetylhexosaminidase n=1 Tax=Psychrobacillus sp. FJAT-21963 TaxID=1712028 RepID=UPI0006FC530D|nr:beta-N-acetylhexosaminidase [Psychrobacillus sp. FJAT-21963]KQL35060.1 beta-hexosaminidase [Psychrobacillus sp. FJAT-21963]
MIKKVGIILLVFVIMIAVKMYLGNKQEIKEVNHQEEVPIREMPLENENLVSLVFDAAEKGQAWDIPFFVGETDIQEVHQLWGTPEKMNELSSKIYEDYFSKDATIGHLTNLVFDIRSSSPEIQQIELEDIKKLKGQADEVRSYQDAKTNQIILVYNVTSTYQLKWVLPKPTESIPNPKVDHISIFTEVKEEVSTDIAVIKEMSLEEKVGQMIFAGIDGTSLSKESRLLISNDKVGGIILFKDNLKDVDQSISLLNELKGENEKNKFPIFLGVDQEGGRVSRLPELIQLPTNQEIGRLNDSSLSYNIGNLLGKELNAFGFNLDFAPVLDINSNPKNPVIGDRSFGNNARIVSTLGIQTMKGIQHQRVIPVVKHFPGHGDTAVDSHKELPIIQKSLEELQALELIPFNDAIKNGADVVMVGHILMPKIDPTYPSSMSNELITNILREKLKFEGVVITDDMTMGAILDNYKIGEAAVEAVKAGNDIVLIAHDYVNIKEAIDSILLAVNEGQISEERINTSVERILLLKEKYKLSNERVDRVNIEELNQTIVQILGR